MANQGCLGIGLETHESPYLRGGSDDIILVGHTFSDEPGIYIEGKVSNAHNIADTTLIEHDIVDRLVSAWKIASTLMRMAARGTSRLGWAAPHQVLGVPDILIYCHMYYSRICILSVLPEQSVQT